MSSEKLSKLWMRHVFGPTVEAEGCKLCRQRIREHTEKYPNTPFPGYTLGGRPGVTYTTPMCQLGNKISEQYYNNETKPCPSPGTLE